MIKKAGIITACLISAIVFSFSHQSAYAGCGKDDETTVIEVVDNREYADLVIAQVDGSYVNIRDSAGTDGKILGKLYNNSVGHFIEEENGWYKITSGTVTGYVSGEYCVRGLEALKIARDVEVTYATINVSTLNIRSKPNTTSSILGTFSKGDELEVLSTEDGFAKVSYNNKTAYISLDYVDLSTEFVEAESLEEERARLAAEAAEKKKAQAAAEAALKKKQEAEAAQAAAAAATASQTVSSSDSSSASLGQQVADYAVQFVGNPYRYGGTSLTNGCDCSGFTMSVYAAFGISLPRTGQRSAGYAVSSYAEAQPGDLLFYSGHVALYIGNGQIVHAATPSQGIVIGSATYAKILAIRRIF